MVARLKANRVIRLLTFISTFIYRQLRHVGHSECRDVFGARGAGWDVFWGSVALVPVDHENVCLSQLLTKLHLC